MFALNIKVLVIYLFVGLGLAAIDARRLLSEAYIQIVE